MSVACHCGILLHISTVEMLGIICVNLEKNVLLIICANLKKCLLVHGLQIFAVIILSCVFLSVDTDSLLVYTKLDFL